MAKKKILILTASPIRDKIVDELIAEELRARGSEVRVEPCLRKGREAILEIQPNVVVVPPIRNVYSRDLVEVIKRWGIGVVSRHTEPSCDWQDFKKLNPMQKNQILGAFPYHIDTELVWSKDESEILNRRGAKFPTCPIGATTCDAYYRDDIIARYKDRKSFNAKHGFKKSNLKKNLLIVSPWGFADSAPDLRIDDTDKAKFDIEGRDRHLDMIQRVCEALKKDKWNILVSIHPDVLEEPYRELCKKLNNNVSLDLDVESIAFELMVNSDALIHAGSTMAISAHLLKIPAYQFGDVNVKGSDSWWSLPESTISQVSPYFKDADDLIKILRQKYRRYSNADKETIRKLEQGRYGKMDGRATIRAADYINKVNGDFKLCWPESARDYTQLAIQRNVSNITKMGFCGICRHQFFIIKQEWLDMLAVAGGITEENKRNILSKYGTCCPWCGSKFYV